MKIAYLPIEPYPERYTEMLCSWVEKRWSKYPEVDLHVVRGEQLAAGIHTGRVLDAHGRAYWSGKQTSALVKLLCEQEFCEQDVIFFEDMFTPGYEAVPYILAQLDARQRPRIYARNYAQSVDPDDFTFAMRAWMRHYEQMVHKTAAGVVCASTVHRDMMHAAILDCCPISIVGLPHDLDDVQSRCPVAVPALDDRELKVVYASRLDAEKNPHFMLDVAEALHRQRSDAEFVICTGAQSVRSNDPTVAPRVAALCDEGVVRVALGSTKASYYAELATARVQLNTARQDFVSFTAIEASTFGTQTLAPAFRSFPEAMRNRAANLFVPWSLPEALSKLVGLLTLQEDASDVGWLARTQHSTLDRLMRLFAGIENETPWCDLL